MSKRPTYMERLKATSPPIPEDLKSLRLALGMTIQQCADMVHVNKSNWSRWESLDDTYATSMSMMAWDLFVHKARTQIAFLMNKIKELEEQAEKV